MAKRNKIIFLFLIFFISIGLFFTNNFLSAKTLKDAFSPLTLGDAAARAGYDTNSDKSLIDIIATVIYIFVSFAGIVFTCLILYGGYLWMADRGNSENIEKAKKLFTAAIIGIIIMFSAYAITWFVVKRLGDETLIEPSSGPTSIETSLKII